VKHVHHGTATGPVREFRIIHHRHDGLATLSDMHLTKSESHSRPLKPDAQDCREPEALARARGALAVVCSDAFGWPSDPRICRQIGNCAEWLKDDLETYEGLLDGRIHPVIEFPELDQIWSGDALEQAIEKVIWDIVAGASALEAGMGEQAAGQADKGDGEASRNAG
jgi:hypothetical protein